MLLCYRRIVAKCSNSRRRRHGIRCRRLHVHNLEGWPDCFLPARGRFIHRKAEAGADEPFIFPGSRGFLHELDMEEVQESLRKIEGDAVRALFEARSKDRPLEVHHKIQLTPENVKNPDIALGWNNLELLCKTCHEQEKERRAKRWRIGKDGKVSLRLPP